MTVFATARLCIYESNIPTWQARNVAWHSGCIYQFPLDAAPTVEKWLARDSSITIEADWVLSRPTVWLDATCPRPFRKLTASQLLRYTYQSGLLATGATIDDDSTFDEDQFRSLVHQGLAICDNSPRLMNAPIGTINQDELTIVMMISLLLRPVSLVGFQLSATFKDKLPIILQRANAVGLTHQPSWSAMGSTSFEPLGTGCIP